MIFITDISIDLADPLLWVIGGIVIAILAFVLIYFKIFAGETRPGH